MPKIHLLDRITVDQIAAGEAVERPASVVKELVENALDAGAKCIAVEIKGAGRELVRVTDDGCGMEPEDAELAFERHATSKISTIGDLDSLGTMGFRGEALSSIAAVAKVELLTREEGRAVGTMVTVHGGQLVSVKEAARERGTSVYVRDLFHNVPARRKFMRNPRTEAAHVADVVGRVAIARPDVSISLVSDGRELLATRGDGDRLGAIAAVLGRERAAEMLPVAMERGRLRVSGFAARPSVTRSSAQHQLFYVNGRPVTSAALSEAVEDGYGGFVMKERHPVVALLLDVPPSVVDVNVHPTKREVRFREELAVYELVRDALRSSLSSARLIPEPMARPSQQARPIAKGARGQLPSDAQQRLEPSEGRGALAVDIPAPTASVEEAGDLPLPRDARAVGQVLCTYVVVEHSGGLIVLDQHAAHERVVFEALKKGRGAAPARQTLLAPLTVELDAGAMGIAMGMLEMLAELGFNIEQFGPRALLVRSLPVVAGELESAERLHDLLADLERVGRAKTLEARRDELLHRVACHAAIRAGEALSPERMQRLLSEMRKLAVPYTCPHGRPVAIALSRRDLERLFGRA
jgi:DNA mismatch repair protein MutL